MKSVIIFILLLSEILGAQNSGSVVIESDGNFGSLIITKDPTGQTEFSPALLVQDKPNTIYPPIRNTGILFEVRGNNSSPIGRPLFQVQGEGAVRMWDYCNIVPSLIPISQWFPDPHILGIGSDLAGSPGAVNLAIQNQRDSAPNAPGGHPFIKLVDMNTGILGMIPGENRLFITGAGSFKFGDDDTQNPNIVPYWPGTAYTTKYPNIAIRNTVGQTGSDFGGLYSKFIAVQDTISFINSLGERDNIITRDPISNTLEIHNQNELKLHSGIDIDGVFKISTSFPISGSSVQNGSIFKGDDGALYYKSDAGTVTLIAPN